MSKLKEIWENQASSIKNEVIRERVENIPGLNCYVGTISFSKAKIFLLELEASLPIHTNYLVRFIGVEIQILPINNERKELAIILLENELSDIFTYFIEDIISSLINIENQEEAVLLVSQKIGYWKKLFSKFTGGLLTPQQQRGLFGELYFLKLLLDRFYNVNKVIQSWQAPNGSNQDFYFNGIAIEVKTSNSNSPSIKISNEFQLENFGFENLYVAFYKLNEFPGNEYSLYKLIVEIRSEIQKNIEALLEFNQKLESLGMTSDSENEYNSITYTIPVEKYYLIASEFPKITSKEIDKAISKVSYEIAPNQCSSFEVTIESILTEITDEYQPK